MSNNIIPINGTSDSRAQIAQMNANFAKLDAETVRKQFGIAGANNLVIGLYDNVHFGLVFYDTNGVPVQLIGQAPDDGRMGVWTAKPGENVMTLLGA